MKPNKPDKLNRLNKRERPEEEERFLGIDYGEKRIGIAISDPLFLIATPLKTIARKKIVEDLREITRIFSIKKIIIGYPLRTDGEKGKRTVEVEKFAKKIKEKFNIEIELWDERFSTIEAERLMRDRGEKPSRDKKRVDRIAASLILQSYLDSIREEE